ncbi:MAG: metalloregulator ArsR/SmtB family transcription factor [Bacillota bacterium]
MELIQLLKALSDETRLRILNLLTKEELCVCEIEYLLNINQSNASRHLNKLWVSKIITYEKRAQWVYYKLNEKLIKEYPFISELLSNELNKMEISKLDLDRLNDYKNSDLTCENIKLLSKC